MASRMFTHTALLYHGLLSTRRAAPGSLPVVSLQEIYNGGREWNAPQELEGLVRECEGSASKLALRYEVLDVSRLDLDRPELEGNCMAALFRFRRNRDRKKAPGLAIAAREGLQRIGARKAWHGFLRWLEEFLPKVFPGTRLEEIDNR